jgi:N-acetyl sugar amidotransferase
MYPNLWSDDVEQRIRSEARNLDPQERPATVQMCTRCVMTNQRPRIVFDDEGVCSACRYAERKRNGIDWAAREQQLRDLLDRHRSSGAVAGYDCIVPASGGKDSSFVATTLRDYGMNPLCARFAPFMTTDVGERNWQSFIHSGFDTVTMQPNGLLHRKLARLAFEFYGDPFQPFTYGQLCWPMHVAAMNGVTLVFYGENGEAEYGGDPSANDKPCWSAEDWDRVYHKGAAIERLLKIGRDLGAITDEDAYALSPFYGLPEDRPEFHWLGYYLPWHPQGNFYTACERTGFEPNEERSEGTYSKYASLDDKLDGLHYYMAYVKFGIGRCTSDAAHEIRDGEIDRDEALALVKRYDGEFPTRHLTECLDYLGMDREALDAAIERFRGPQVSLRAAA